MAFLVGGANSASGAYEISNSCRFDGSSSYLNHTHESGNKDTFTWSSWIKFGDLNNDSSADVLFSASDTSYIAIRFEDKQLDFVNYDGSDTAEVSTNRLFRDVSAWYHIVVAIDMTQSTDSNRVKLYVNGSQETSFATAAYQPQNQDTVVNTAIEHRIGRESGNYFSGYMADVNFIDGTAYAASYFGETNDNGVWIPKKPDVTYGTNGYFLEFKQTGTSANSSGIGADTSGEDNHHAVSGLAATDITVDTPTNNFCTYNLLATPSSLAQYGTFSEGNTTYTGHSNGSYGSSATGTFGVASGKWYWESKLTTDLSNGIGTGIRDIAEWNPDWANDSTFNHTDGGGDGGYAYNYNSGNPQRNNSESTTNAGSAISQNDIVMHAMDLDNGALYYGINGTWQASSDPESGASKTNAQHSFTVAGVYAPAAYSYSSRAFATNFGNPSFSISSGNADANGYGNFEYAVPSGYYALCTKNLADYG